MLCVTLLLLVLLLRRLVRIVVRILDENDDDDDDDDGIKDDGGAEANNSSVNITFLFAVDGVINVVRERGESIHFTRQKDDNWIESFLAEIRTGQPEGLPDLQFLLFEGTKSHYLHIRLWSFCHFNLHGGRAGQG
jgi:hypothetical protein